MMWFDIVKSHPSEGNTPHFFQWLTRVFRPASEQTPQYLDRYLGWDEVDDTQKELIKEMFDSMEKKRQTMPGSRPFPKPGYYGGSRQKGIAGIRVDFTDINKPVVDRGYFDNWRSQQKKPMEAGSRWGGDRWDRERLYRIIQTFTRRH